MKILLSILLTSIVLIYSDGVVFSQPNELEGTWVKIRPDTPLGGYSIKFTFAGDKFFLRRGVYIDFIDPNDTCRKNRGWIDFASGNYNIENGKVLLKGIWTDSTFKDKQVYGCSDLGDYRESYYYRINNDTLIFNKNEALFDESKKYPHVYDMLVLIRSSK